MEKMKKTILIIGIAVLLIAVVLSAYVVINRNADIEKTTSYDTILLNSTKVTGDTDKLKITGYIVTTFWSESDTWNSTFSNKKPGFYHEYPDDVNDVIFDVEGTIKNIVSENLDTVQINVIFCDTNNITLAKENNIIHDLSSDISEEFHVYITLVETLHFTNINNVRFEVLVL